MALVLNRGGVNVIPEKPSPNFKLYIVTEIKVSKGKLGSQRHFPSIGEICNSTVASVSVLWTLNSLILSFVSGTSSLDQNRLIQSMNRRFSVQNSVILKNLYDFYLQYSSGS